MYVKFANGSEAKTGVPAKFGVFKSVLAAMAMTSHRELMTATLWRQRGNKYQALNSQLDPHQTRLSYCQMEEYTLICLVLGTKDTLLVKIKKDQLVAELKDEIKNKKAHKFKDVDADELTLHQIKIVIPDIHNPQSIMQEVSQPGYVFNPKTELFPTFRMSDYFGQGPEGDIHVLVELPPTNAGEKRRLPSDDSLPGPQGPSPKKRHTEKDESALSAIHAMAWGTKWPHRLGKIHETEIIDNNNAGSVDDDNAISDDDNTIPEDPVFDHVDRSLADLLKVPPVFEYKCLTDMNRLKEALGLYNAEEDVLVVLSDYEILLKDLEQGWYKDKHCVVTGHPGTGKTTFLFYLLLCRLEQRLPTAVQLGTQSFYIFDEQGATIHHKHDKDERLAQCWALVDYNELVKKPCEPFTTRAKRVILISSPRPDKWWEWKKQKRAHLIVSDLPSVPEIAAIMKELNRNPRTTLSLVYKWGPSVRNVLRSIDHAANHTSDPIDSEVQVAVTRTCGAGLSTVLSASDSQPLPMGIGSSFIYLRRALNNHGDLSICAAFIPTLHLVSIFEERRCRLENKESIKLFCALSSHALTRTSAGWAHEKSVHERLALGGAPLTLYRKGEQRVVQTSTDLIPGTLAGLKKAGVSDSFYWMPSVANFPGVDGVLGNTDGHVYTIQATIAEDHEDPTNGIRKVWAQMNKEVRETRTWHSVIVVDNKQTARGYMNDSGDITLGRNRKKVYNWVCDLSD